jgi:hypothetical protein
MSHKAYGVTDHIVGQISVHNDATPRVAPTGASASALDAAGSVGTAGLATPQP